MPVLTNAMTGKKAAASLPTTSCAAAACQTARHTNLHSNPCTVNKARQPCLPVLGGDGKHLQNTYAGRKQSYHKGSFQVLHQLIGCK